MGGGALPPTSKHASIPGYAMVLWVMVGCVVVGVSFGF